MVNSKRAGNLIIRRARVSDASAVADLLGDLGYRCSQKFARERIRQLLHTKNDRVFVAVEEKAIAGFASCHVMPMFHQSGFLCRVTALCVLPDRRAAGIGRLLMKTVEDFARLRYCVKVEVTSGAQRKNAHKFYRRIGYHVVSARFIKEL